jgi:hypothetical protein
MKVWVVWGENCTSRDGEVAWIVGVYRTKKAARAAVSAEKKSLREMRDGVRFYGEDEDVDWDVDINVEEHDLG